MKKKKLWNRIVELEIELAQMRFWACPKCGSCPQCERDTSDYESYLLDTAPDLPNDCPNSAKLDALIDARSALRYIEQRYGRLDGVGWDRVIGPEERE